MAKAERAKTSPGKAPASDAKKPEKTRGPAKGGFTREEIALRAYFIAEKRQQTGASGDETSDWVEAERQLRAEWDGKA